MKTKIQARPPAAKKKNPSPAKPRSSAKANRRANVDTKRPPSQAFESADRFESEACQIGAAFSQFSRQKPGEESIGIPGITPLAQAGNSPLYSKPSPSDSSHGLPLDSSIRQTLERFFKRDLGKTRIHNGHAASHQAKSVGAKAFAQGNDLYFARGQYDPFSLEGQELLAHEIAHSLQQADGHRKDIQLKKDKPLYEILGHDANTMEQDMRLAHETHSPELKAKLPLWYDPLKNEIFTITLAKEDRAKAIRKAIKGAVAANGTNALSLLADFLRLTGDYDFVIEILQLDPNILTLRIATPVFARIDKTEAFENTLKKSVTESVRGKSYLPQILEKTLKYYARFSYYSSDLTERYKRQLGDNGKTIGALMLSFDKDIKDYTVLTENELEFKPLLIIDNIESSIVTTLKNIDTAQFPADQKLKSKKTSPVAEHLNSLETLQNKASEWRNQKLAKPYSWIGKYIADIVSAAIDPTVEFWNEIYDKEKDRYDDSDPIAASKIRDVLGEAYHADPKSARNIDPFASKILKQAKKFFAVDTSTPLDQSAVFKKSPALAKTFMGLIDGIIVQLMLKKSNAAAGSEHERSAALFASALNRIHNDLYLMTQKGLSATPEPYRIDEIINRRLIVASDLLHLSAQFAEFLPAEDGGAATASKSAASYVSNWKQLRDIATQVINGNYAVKFGQLAFTEKFSVDPSSKIKQFAEDLEFFYDLPFDISYVERYYKLQYNTVLIEHLKTVMTDQALVPFFKRDVSMLWTFDKAMEKVKADNRIHKPKRYVSSKVTWVQGTDTSISFANRLTRHQRYLDLKAMAKKNQEFTLLKFSPVANEDGDKEAIVWTFPNQNSFISPLREVALFNGLVSVIRKKDPKYFKKKGAEATDAPAATKPKPTTEEKAKEAEYELQGSLDELFADAITAGADKEANKDIGDMKWVTHLLKYEPIFTRAKVIEKAGALETKTLGDLNTSIDDRNRLTIQSISTDRKIIGAYSTDGILTLLKMYDAGDPRTFQYVDRAIKFIGKFRNSLGRMDDSELQIALLMLEVESGLKHVYLESRGWNGDWIFEYVSMAQRNAKMALELNEELYRFSKSNLEDRVETLGKVKDRLIGNLQDLQNQFGIRAFKASGKENGNTFESNLGGLTVYAGENRSTEEEEDTDRGFFKLHGTEIQLLNVYDSFTYFPPMGLQGATPELAKDLYGLPPILLKGSHRKVPKNIKAHQQYSKSEQNKVLVTVQVRTPENIVNFDIKVKDLYGKQMGLEWLSGVVHTKANLNSLENLRVIIETFGEVMMFVMSLTPAGWAILAAEIVQAIVELTGDEGLLKDLEKALSDPKAVLDGIGSFFEEKLTVDFLFDALVNGDFNLPDFISKTGTHKAKETKPNKKRKGLGKIIANLRELGTVIGLRMQDFQQKAQLPVQALSNNIISRPLLSRVLAYVAANWGKSIEELLLEDKYIGPIFEFIYVNQSRIQSLVKTEGRGADIDFVSVADAMGSVTDPIEDVLKSLTEFEFPEEIVPTEELLEFLISYAERFAVKRLKGKAKLVAMAFTGIAEVANLNDDIANLMLPAARKLNLDPNLYWKDTILPKYKKPAEDTIHDFGEMLKKLVGETPILKDFVTTDDIKVPESVTVTGSSEHDALFGAPSTGAELKRVEGKEVIGENVSANPAEGAVNERQSELDVAPALDRDQLRNANNNQDTSSFYQSAGDPLPNDIRGRAESDFGRSLNHVRLHQNASSRNLNNRYQSHALTSGSHIFLNDRINPRQSFGKSILYHEIGHTLQNTGSKSSSPMPPQRGSGLDLSPEREQGAESMRKMAANPSVGQVPIIGGRGKGFAPTLDSKIFAKFLGSMSDFRKLPERAKAVEDGARRKTSDIDPTVLASANTIWELFSKPILDNVSAKTHYAKFIKEDATVKDSVFKYTQDKLKAFKPTVLNGLAKKHQKTKRPPKNAPKGTKPTFTLGARDLVKDLEGYFYGTNGIHLQIKKFKYKVKADKPTKPTIESQGVTISYVDLHIVEQGRTQSPIKPVWTVAMSKTFNKGGALYKSDEAVNNKKRATLEALNAIWTEGSTEPRIMIWDGNEPKLSLGLKTKVSELLAISKITNEELPPWHAYMETTEQRTKDAMAGQAAFSNANPQAGMHLATHGHFKKKYELAKADRQSHHTTQFLLPEYFFCKKESYRPFKKNILYPGLDLGAGTFTNLKTGNVIKLHETFKTERGGAMPAILLSGFVHLNSGLHLAPEKDGDGNSSQGLKIHFAYKKHIDSKIGPEVESQAKLNAYIGTKHTNPVEAKKEASNEIEMAIRNTYADMRLVMREGLVKNMPGNAYAYYKKVATKDGTEEARGKDLMVDKSGNPVDEATMKGELKKRAKEVYDNKPKDPVLLNKTSTSISKPLNDHVMEGLGWYYKRSS